MLNGEDDDDDNSAKLLLCLLSCLLLYTILLPFSFHCLDDLLYTENDSPHPHEAFAFGFSNVNSERRLSLTKSIFVPIIDIKAFGSMKIGRAHV